MQIILCGISHSKFRTIAYRIGEFSTSRVTIVDSIVFVITLTEYTSLSEMFLLTNGKINTLRKIVPEGLESCSKELIYKFFRKSCFSNFSATNPISLLAISLYIIALEKIYFYDLSS